MRRDHFPTLIERHLSGRKDFFTQISGSQQGMKPNLQETHFRGVCRLATT